jgi:glucosamine-phosphate N-acetyltransferase
LLRLDFHRSPAKFNPFISAAAPGEPWLCVRPLKAGDYHRGFLQSLAQLTSVGDVSESEFLSKCKLSCELISSFRIFFRFSNCLYLPDRFAHMRASGDYYVTVIEDLRSNKIIGSATLVLEQKFIHGCAVRGRLEDVVVDDTYRGKQLGKL